MPESILEMKLDRKAQSVSVTKQYNLLPAQKQRR